MDQIWKAVFELPRMKQKKTLGFQNGHGDDLQRGEQLNAFNDTYAYQLDRRK